VSSVFIALLVVLGFQTAPSGNLMPVPSVETDSLRSTATAPAGDARGTRADSVRQVPFFRPKVVVYEQIIIPKDPFLGGTLSLILPGTGQAYCGKWLKGIGFLTATLFAYGSAGRISDDSTYREGPRKAVGGLLALVGIGLHVWSVLDGVNTANAHNRQLLQ